MAKPGTIIQLVAFGGYLVALDNQGNWFSGVQTPTPDPSKAPPPVLSLVWSQMPPPDTSIGPPPATTV